VRPEFDDLVGDDVAPDERSRLERVHELLLEVGPPPEPVAAPIELRARRRRGAVLAIAAALAVAAFALGAALVDGSGRTVDFTAPMTGTASAAGATASLTVFEADDAGNWPMELEVEGLPAREGGGRYELWLTRDGDLTALCGSFLTDSRGWAAVPMNAPYRFEGAYGWVIVEEGSKTPLLTT
jgi:hypothetical protein